MIFSIISNNFSKKLPFWQLLRPSFKMYSQSATDLGKLSSNDVKTWLQSFDTVLTDCDGKHM